jgi:hypothetical protein
MILINWFTRQTSALDLDFRFCKIDCSFNNVNSEKIKIHKLVYLPIATKRQKFPLFESTYNYRNLWKGVQFPLLNWCYTYVIFKNRFKTENSMARLIGLGSRTIITFVFTCFIWNMKKYWSGVEKKDDWSEKTNFRL